MTPRRGQYTPPKRLELPLLFAIFRPEYWNGVICVGCILTRLWISSYVRSRENLSMGCLEEILSSEVVLATYELCARYRITLLMSRQWGAVGIGM